jgi:hypothetical protein
VQGRPSGRDAHVRLLQEVVRVTLALIVVFFVLILIAMQ